LVEHRTENPGVGGSIPPLTILFSKKMKNLLIFLSLFFIVSGCKSSRDAARETKTVVKEYAKGLATAPSKTKAVTELASLRQAINIYKLEKGTFPEELSDLPVKIENPDDYEYNFQTGKVKSKQYPNL
jgi:TATA-box binding protein (TBP) (component of TFIID and TFIIIB)